MMESYDVMTRCDSSDESPEDAESAAAEEKALTDILQKLAFDDFSNLEKGVFPNNELCSCGSCKDRRSWASECLEELKLVQSHWLELRQYVRIIYRLAMKNSLKSLDGNYHLYMKDIVSRLCEVCDPHQLYQRLEAQVREFVIEIKVRLLQLMDKLADNPELPILFISGMLDRYNKLMTAAAEVAPVLSQLEEEHLSKFKLSWKLLNQRLFQTSIYTDSFFQNSVPLFITQLGKIRDSEESKSLVHDFLQFDDEVTLVEGLWKEVATHIHQYSQEHAAVLSRQRLLKEDWHEIKLLKLRPKICYKNKLTECKESKLKEEQCEEISLGTEDVCECHVCLELISSHASIEMMDTIFNPPIHRMGFNLYSHSRHSAGEDFDESCLDQCSSSSSPTNEEIHVELNLNSDLPNNSESETIDQNGLLSQMRVDKATQKDQEVQSYDREPPRQHVKKKSIGTDTNSVKDASTDSHCTHSCNHAKHADKIKRISWRDFEDSKSKPDNIDSKQSQQCDCCYCEVFGHGMPPTAPISRNYVEMRERLRFILSKKRTNCKANPSVPLEPHTFPEKKGNSKVVSISSDTRNLDELLDYIEGNETKCRNEKKAAKKARQKEKKIQQIKKKEEDERAEQLYQEALAQAALNKNNKEKTVNQLRKNVKNKTVSKSQKEADTIPQMVTIKRIMDSNTAEPTVTITLRGATPNQDRVLYTLLNGQVCEVKEPKKSMKEKIKMNNNNAVTNAKNNMAKRQQSVQLSQNNTISSNNFSVTNGSSISCSTIHNLPGKKLNKKKESNIKEFQTPIVSENNLENNKVPAKQNGLTNPTAIQINNVVNRMSREQKCFKIEDLKLPPGITITKVDPSTVKPKFPLKEKVISKANNMSAPSMRQPPSSEVIVVSTGNLKEQKKTIKVSDEIIDNPVSNQKKKKNKKKQDSNNVPSQKNKVHVLNEIFETDTRNKEKNKCPVTISISQTMCNKNNRSKQIVSQNESSSPLQSPMEDLKKKKKKKSNTLYDINSEEWRILDSVFAPKDIDLENGDIDDAERELEAFKRFCSQSVPPKRKEKVHLNIKDIILKKKSIVCKDN